MHEVKRFTVHVVERMGGMETESNLTYRIGGIRIGNCFVARIVVDDELRKILRIEIFHRQKGVAIASTKIENLEDIGVAQTRRALRFVDNRTEKFVVLRQTLANALANQVLVLQLRRFDLCQIDIGNAAFGNLLDKRIGAKLHRLAPSNHRRVCSRLSQFPIAANRLGGKRHARL